MQKPETLNNKMYNFDEITDRRNTGAVKYERCKALFGSDDVLLSGWPTWILKHLTLFWTP
jgi:hypothetical protein